MDDHSNDLTHDNTNRDTNCDTNRERRALAVRILRALRDGTDPDDGSDLALGHICHRAEVVRALCVALDVLDRESTRVAELPPPRERGASLGRSRRSQRREALPCAEPLPEEETRPVRPRPAPPERAGQPWSDTDDAQLAEAFDGGAALVDLARTFGRSKNSVRSRLVRLGRGDLLEPGPAPRFPVHAAPPAGDVRGRPAESSESLPA